MKKILIGITSLMILLLFFTAFVDQGYAGSIHNDYTYAYTNLFGDFDLATVSVDVYMKDDISESMTEDYGLSLDEYWSRLYVYEMRSVDATPISTIDSFSISKAAEAEIVQVGWIGGGLESNIDYDVYTPNILFSGLKLALNESVVLYFTSDFTEEFANASIGAYWGGAQRDILTPSGHHNPIPEPSTLLLFGTALIGVAGIRKVFFRK